MYKIGAARHPCLVERDIAKSFNMKHISENNRMIDDIIEFVDNEDEEGVNIFVDQQKAFDRMEWGWLNYVMESFNLKRIVQQILRFCLRVACHLQTCIFLFPLRAAPHSRVV
jgi:hypothetical protein